MLLGIVTAIREEYAAVLKFLDDIKTEEFDGVVFARGKLKLPSSSKIERIDVTAPSPTSAGNIASAIVSTRLAKHRPDIIAMVGCAGGIPKKVNLYDVIFADRVIYYEPGKDTVDGFVPRPDQHKPFDVLIQRARIESIGEEWKRLIPEPVNSPFFARVEPIAAGEVLLNAPTSELLKQIKQSAGRAVAVEMEGFGVMEAAHRLGLHGIVVRGVSDMLDKGPDQDIEAEHVAGLNACQVAATANAMAFLTHVLSHADAGALREVDRGSDAQLYIEVDCKPENFAKVVADLSALGDGLSFQNIRIVVGSVKIFAEVDPVFAVLIEKFWSNGDIFKILDLKITTVIVDGANTPEAQEMAKILQTAMASGLEAVATARVLRKFAAEYPKYKSLISNVESSLRATTREQEIVAVGFRKRVKIKVDKKTKDYIQNSAIAKGENITTEVRNLIIRALDADIHPGHIMDAMSRSDARTEIVSTTIYEEEWKQIDKMQQQLGVAHYSRLLGAIVKFAIGLK